MSSQAFRYLEQLSWPATQRHPVASFRMFVVYCQIALPDGAQVADHTNNHSPKNGSLTDMKIVLDRLSPIIILETVGQIIVKCGCYTVQICMSWQVFRFFCLRSVSLPRIAIGVSTDDLRLSSNNIGLSKENTLEIEVKLIWPCMCACVRVLVAWGGFW